MVLGATDTMVAAMAEEGVMGILPSDHPAIQEVVREYACRTGTPTHECRWEIGPIFEMGEYRVSVSHPDCPPHYWMVPRATFEAAHGGPVHRAYVIDEFAQNDDAFPQIPPRPALKTSPAAKGRKTLRGLIGKWSYLRYIHQRRVTMRGPSGRVWRLNPDGVHYVTCKNGHRLKICQAETGRREGIPGEDKVAVAVLYLRNGPEGERELVAKGGHLLPPQCADCHEALGTERPVWRENPTLTANIMEDIRPRMARALYERDSREAYMRAERERMAEPRSIPDHSRNVNAMCIVW